MEPRAEKRAGVQAEVPMHVSEVMKCNPVCCMPTTGVRSAAVLFHRYDIGFLPVIDDWQTRKLVGVVTDRDVCLAALEDPRDVALMTVADCMAIDPVTCTPDMDVRQALATMIRDCVRRIPVVDPAHCVRGVVGIADLIHHRAMEPRDLWMSLNRILCPRRSQGKRTTAAA